MNPIVKKYLRDDTVFNVLNKKFISLEPDDIRKTNKHINKVFIVKTLVLLKICYIYKQKYKYIHITDISPYIVYYRLFQN